MDAPAQQGAPDAPAPDADAAGIVDALERALDAAAEETAIAAALPSVRVLTITVQDDGSVEVDVDGTAAMVDASELGGAGDAPADAPPPPPPPAA